MLRQVLNRGLKHRKLIRDKRIAVNEVLPVQKIAVSLGAVHKVKQCLKIVHLGMIDIGQQANPFVIFHEQPFLDHFGDIGAGQLHPVGKTVQNLGEVVALLAAHLSKGR